MSFDGIKRTALERITAGAEGARLIGSQLASLGYTSQHVQGLLAELAARVLPGGGTTGQVLKKTSGTDYAVAWQAESGGSSAASETVAGIAELATQTETNTGTDDARIVTPLKLASRTALDTRAGVVELATDTETQTGTDTARAITPANLSARSATETRTGVAEIATQTETDTGTDDARFVTPLKLATRPQKNVVFENYIDGLNLVWASPGTNFNNITATPGACWIPGSSKVLNFPSTLTPTTGTPSATTWYHFYVYDNAGTPAIEVSTTAPVAYKGNSYQKTGDATRRYIASRKTDGSGKFYNFQKIGVTVRYLENQNQSPFTVLANGTSTTEATVSCTAAVPVTARSVKVQLENTSTTQIAWFGSSIDSVTGGTAAGIGYVQTQKQYADFLALDSSQAFSYWFSAAPTNGLYCMILGFEEVR
jgi:hypothetical protein